MLKKFALIPYSTYLQSFRNRDSGYTKTPDNHIDRDNKDNSEDQGEEKGDIYRPQQNSKGHTIYMKQRSADTKLMPPPGKGEILDVEKSTESERSPSPDSSARTLGNVIPKSTNHRIGTKIRKEQDKSLTPDVDIDVVGEDIGKADKVNKFIPRAPSRKVKTDSGVIEVKTRSGRVSKKRRPYWLDG